MDLRIFLSSSSRSSSELVSSSLSAVHGSSSGLFFSGNECFMEVFECFSIFVNDLRWILAVESHLSVHDWSVASGERFFVLHWLSDCSSRAKSPSSSANQVIFFEHCWWVRNESRFVIVVVWSRRAACRLFDSIRSIQQHNWRCLLNVPIIVHQSSMFSGRFINHWRILLIRGCYSSNIDHTGSTVAWCCCVLMLRTILVSWRSLSEEFDHQQGILWRASRDQILAFSGDLFIQVVQCRRELRCESERSTNEWFLFDRSTDRFTSHSLHYHMCSMDRRRSNRRLFGLWTKKFFAVDVPLHESRSDHSCSITR